MSDTSAQFTGNIPESYDRGLGPVLFEPYAKDLASRIAAHPGEQVLELAAGTGRLTGHIVERFGDAVSLTATDLNDAMLDLCRSRFAARPITFAAADATQLPFDNDGFDVVVCQFGAMFFPDKPLAMREAFRVLKPGGRFYFNVWDQIENNALLATCQAVVTKMFTGDPPSFYKVPFGYYDVPTVLGHVEGAGFVDARATPVEITMVSHDTDQFVDGLIHGNPIVFEIQELGPNAVDIALSAVRKELTARFGDDPISAQSRAIVVEARKQ